MIRRDLKPDLRILLIEITQKCNAGCLQCGSRCDAYGEETLRKDEILAVLSDIREHLGTGVMLNITGGEPLLRHDLFDIMSEATAMGFDWGMVTNGTLLTEEAVEGLKKSGCKTVTVSIDGMRETHEALRVMPGSFDRIIAGLKRLKKAAFLDHLQVTFTFNERNYREFPELYALLSEIGINSIRTSSMDPIGRAMDHSELLPGREAFRFMFDQVEKANAFGKVPVEWGCCHFLPGEIYGREFLCFAGIYAASILYNGDIFVCPNVPREPELIQGNIRTDRFSYVWKTGFQYYRNRPLPAQCQTCEYADQCAGDSLHTMDFSTGAPKFCYKEFFEGGEDAYRRELANKYGDYSIITVGEEEGVPDVYLEPGAYRDIRGYFHFGRKHPLSAFEQQMGLVGYRMGKNYVIKYVFPSFVDSKDVDLARFTKETIPQAMRETSIIRRNFRTSEDGGDFQGKGLRFLGFVHSHPAQSELQYSTGDESIHRKMVRRFGDYIGMLVNPMEETIGAYFGPDIVQANLKIIETRGER